MISAVIERCAGIDVGKKFLAVCVMTGPAAENPTAELRKFGTIRAELERLREWLKSEGCTHVVMESTGCYWKPALNVLEDDPEYRLEVVLANAQQVKAVTGHKTDPHDACCLAHIPPRAQRELRDLTRRRKQMVRAAADERNRAQKMRDSDRFLITRAMRHMAFLAEEIEALDQEIARSIGSPHLTQPNQLPQTIPGIRTQAAAAMLAEAGPNMQQFPSVSHFSSWSGIAPGKQRKRRETKTCAHPAW